MGLFGVNMPTIYGEGQLAFVRLQEEILKLIPDQSLFAWERPQDPGERAEVAADRVLFATAPADFALSGRFESVTTEEAGRLVLGFPSGIPPAYTVTPLGLRTALPLISPSPTVSIAFLACKTEQDTLVGLVLQRETPYSHIWSVGATSEDLVGGWANYTISPGSSRSFHRLIHSLPSMKKAYSRINAVELCVALRPTHTLASRPRMGLPLPVDTSPARMDEHSSYTIRVPTWCRSRLLQQGYAVSVSSIHDESPLRKLPRTYAVRLQGDTSLDICFGPCSHCSEPPGWWLAWWLASASHAEVGGSEDASQPDGAADASACATHVGNWECTGEACWRRRTRLVLRSTTLDRETITLELVLTCDYLQDDENLPSSFSLTIDVSPADPLPTILHGHDSVGSEGSEALEIGLPSRTRVN